MAGVEEKIMSGRRSRLAHREAYVMRDPQPAVVPAYHLNPMCTHISSAPVVAVEVRVTETGDEVYYDELDMPKVAKQCRMCQDWELPAPPSWRAAACHVEGEDLTDLFFAREGSALQQHALAICRGCRMRTQCRQWADDTEATFGVYGGETVTQRKERWKIEGRN